mmetsp:Transcript_27336/g.60225  ORF Transcript_27336/g.60225 Transcript_27336/m.60225 type:complete len:277 (-) Transcript_27336:2774-3604(-)
MCGPTTTNAPKGASFASPNGNPASKSEERSSIFQKVYPLHPSVALGVMATTFAIFPSSLYVNRGFTVWFHWASVFYLLTQSKFMNKFLILSGISICLGWYACLMYEYVVHDRFFDALYKNMPSSLTKYMLLDDDARTSATNNALNATASVNGTLDFLSTYSLLAMFVSHILDFLGHPLLTYYFWWKYNSKNDSETNPKQNIENNETIFTWPVIVTAYCSSRIWSLFHTYYNFGFFAWFYVGFDVYVMDDLDSWYPPYAMETLLYSSLVIWKVLYQK